MPTLPRELRNRLAKTCLDARRLSERAARAALENLAVHEREYRGHMTVEQRQLRNRLRARARSLGDERRVDTGIQAIESLVEQTAYEHWHRLLFTRFLAENHLLMTDEAHGLVPVTLEDCAELASELGAKDGVDLACRFASRQLPEIFRVDDPVLELDLALNDQVELRRLADALPTEVFTASDSLGWVYQFWQAERKDQVNASGKKIGAEELPAVTQLFTEDYMVEFLLHNTLGAWWAGKLGPIQAATEAEARAKAGLPAKEGLAVHWTYLRFLQDEATGLWSPASGTYPGWPRQAAQVTVLDPCMGSGHFLTFALPILTRLRIEEEHTSLAKAVYLVLDENLHGLEIDERCTQIGFFNLALSAWITGGWQDLPTLHVACSGLAVTANESEWISLADGDANLQYSMEVYYKLFKNAPTYGSLIDPIIGGDSIFDVELCDISRLLNIALIRKDRSEDSIEFRTVAANVEKVYRILMSKFTLISTNFPFLGLEKMDSNLSEFIKANYNEGRRDLATAFILRSKSWIKDHGIIASVSPSEWTFLRPYRDIRLFLIEFTSFKIMAYLGKDSFDAKIRANPVLTLIGNIDESNPTFVIDVSNSNITEKPISLQSEAFDIVNQKEWKSDFDYKFTRCESEDTIVDKLEQYADARTGLSAGDSESFERCFWETGIVSNDWEFLQGSVSTTNLYAGRSNIVHWEQEKGRMYLLAESVKHLNHAAQNWRRGKPLWGKKGIALSLMGKLPATIYLGDPYNINCCAIVPKKQEDLLALWAYASTRLGEDIRKFDKSLKVGSPKTLLSVKFNLEYWRNIATELFPDGIPDPFSNDPTQWLFKGHLWNSDQPLHVAVARLIGYQWPRQTGSSFPDCPALDADGLEVHADPDGIVCLPSLQGDQPAVHRLRALLAAALDTVDEATLLAGAGPKGSKSRTLEEWLRDECFEQHCQIFHQRPFIWHIWDGRKDGFAALVNYHKLDNATLQKLTYSHLGAWIRQQEEDAKGNVSGAAERLGAARVLQQELIRILEGDAPYDIFVRWKPLKQQAVGWQPDLNDGVRMNIRPFLQAKNVGKTGAGILRAKPNIKWDKDRGAEPNRPKEDYPWFWCDTPPGTDPKPGKVFVGARWNDVHLTLTMKSS